MARDALNDLTAIGIGDWVGKNTFCFDASEMVDRVEGADYNEKQAF